MSQEQEVQAEIIDTLPAEVKRLNTNVEKITNTIENIVETGFEAWEKHLDKQDRQDERANDLKAQEIEAQKEHSRKGFYTIWGILGAFVIIILACLGSGNADLAEKIITTVKEWSGGIAITLIAVLLGQNKKGNDKGKK